MKITFCPTAYSIHYINHKETLTLKKFITAVVLIISILVIVLGVLSSRPIVSCDIEIPETAMEAVKSQAKGLYSSILPLVPVYVDTTDYSEDTVYYTIHYFPFGSVEMSYSEIDGYNIEKQLTKLS